MARRREEKDDVDVIVGTFSIYSVPYFSLIDVGSIDSYVACDVAVKLGIGVEETKNVVTIVITLGYSILVNIKDVL